MAYDVSDLSNYTKEQEAALVTKSLFGGKTASLIQSGGIVLTGVKSSEKIPILDTDVVFQTGGTCGFNSQGTTTLTDRSVEVGKIKVNESLCEKTLEAKATQKKLQLGSEYESLAFEADYANLKAGKTAEALETADWKGDKASGNANLNKYDGFIKIIDATGAAIDGNVSAANSITKANALSIFLDFVDAIPAAILDKDDFRVFTGWDTFRKLLRNITDLNLFHYSVDQSLASGEIIIPGTNVRVIAVHGLDNTSRIFGLRLSNMVLATDLENEEEKFEIFFAKEADEIRYKSEFKRGVNVVLPGEIIEFTLAA
jgi:hypothetical protein